MKKAEEYAYIHINSCEKIDLPEMKKRAQTAYRAGAETSGTASRNDI